MQERLPYLTTLSAVVVVSLLQSAEPVLVEWDLNPDSPLSRIAIMPASYSIRLMAHRPQAPRLIYLDEGDR